MKILIFGNLYGHWKQLIKLEKGKEFDMAIGCGFSGMYTQWGADRGRIFYEIRVGKLPKRIKDKTLHRGRFGGNFCQVVKASKSRKKRILFFSCPTYILKHRYEQSKTIVRINDGRLKIENFGIISNGDVYRLDNISFAGIGGRYSPYPSAPIYKDHTRSHSLYNNYNFRLERDNLRKSNVDLLFINDIIGGWTHNPKGVKLDFKKGERSIDLKTGEQKETEEFGTNNLCEQIGAKYCFLGGFKSELDIFPPFFVDIPDGTKRPYYWVFVRDFQDGDNIYYYVFDTDEPSLSLKEKNIKTGKVNDVFIHKAFERNK